MATKGTVIPAEWSDETDLRTGVHTKRPTAYRGNCHHLHLTNAGGSKLLFSSDRDWAGYGNVYLADLPACDSLPETGGNQ